MRVGSILSGAVLAVVVAGTIPARADVLLPVLSYSMPNGNGQAVFGSWNYWDGNYSGSGIKTGTGADNAPLSGGTGALTDGIISTTGFDGTHIVGGKSVPNSNTDGTGLYVGWKFLNPVITFNLKGTPTVDSINLFVDYQGAPDNSLVGAPVTITIDGTTYVPTVKVLSLTDEELSVSFKGGITATTFSVQPNAGGILSDVTNYENKYGPNSIIDPRTGKATTVEPWMMVSEVQFDGVTNAVPEPSTWAMMLVGFATLGYAAFRRKRAIVLARVG
jgi:hypothetical protein